MNTNKNIDANKPLEAPRFNYSKNKNNWIIFPNQKGKKVNVRKYISGKATRLTQLNDLTFTENRDYLIQAYEINGCETLDKYYLDTLKEILKEQEDGAAKN